MTAEEVASWGELTDLIDVEAYRDAEPLILTETCRVEAFNDGPAEVAWWPSGRKEFISLAVAPPEFAAFDAGEWLEVTVERDRRTFEIRRVRHAAEAEPPAAPLPEQRVARWDGLARTTELPESDEPWGRSP